MAKSSQYSTKRAFDSTPEPSQDPGRSADPAISPAGELFVVQQHHATRLHFDLRLEMEGPSGPTLVSWAVPNNLPFKKGTPHLAIHVEDHPMDYATFSGTIPEGNYGAGEVRVFDTGDYELLEQEPGKLTFRLHGKRLQGVWHMVKPEQEADKEEWLVFLKADERPERDPLPLLKPMMATLRQDAFDDDRWIFEPKWDGVRALGVCGDETRLLSRNARDITNTYPELERLHERLVAIDAIVDGEIVAFDNGRPSFEKLQSRINLQNEHDIQRAMKSIPVSFIAFDVLYLDGKSLIERPVEDRKTILQDLVVPAPKVQVSPFVEGEGVALMDAARQQGLEGIVAKKKGCPYRPGRRAREWQKIKVVHDADVVIGGWSPGEGTRSSFFGSLLVGAYDDEGLRFLGAVGTGFNSKTLEDIVARLKELEADECPFAEGAAGIKGGRFGKPIKNPHWVRPELVAIVEFRELTAGMRLRAPSFKGLRNDKDPEECTIDLVRPQ
jgi:bifunctional non-homologous end joining protein LigD